MSPFIKSETDHLSVLITTDQDISPLLFSHQQKHSAYNITLATDIKTAEHYLLHGHYDLIFIDQKIASTLPESVHITQKTGSINQQTPVIVMTEQTEREVIANDYHFYVTKTALLEQFEATITLCLNKTKSSLQNSEIEFDFVSAMLKKTSKNQELARILFIKLFAELPQQLKNIEQAISSQDLSLAREITHKLHGSVSFCGFTELQATSKELEIDLSAANKPLIKQNFAELKKKVDNFLLSKENILNQLEP